MRMVWVLVPLIRRRVAEPGREPSASTVRAPQRPALLRAGKGELRSRPARRATQGTPSGAVDGVRLLLSTFLGDARKVLSRRATPGYAKQSAR